MALTNSQYNELMRRYSRIRFQHQHEMEERLRHIYAQCPRLLEISKLLPTSSAALAKAKITGNKAQALNAQMQIDALRRERGALLSSLHYTLDDLQPKYSCPDCKDTGYLDGNRKCHCFEQAGISLLYEQSGIRDRLERENFNTFDINRYSDAPNPLLGGMSNRAHMQRLKLIYEKYAYQFKDGNIITIPYQERRQLMNRLMPEHGAPKTMTYLPENEPELMMILKRERFKRSYHATAGNLEEYLDKLEKTTLREKLKRAKTVVSTQEVSSHKRGLER